MSENFWRLAKLKQALMLHLAVPSDGTTSPKAAGKCTDQEAKLWGSEPLHGASKEKCIPMPRNVAMFLQAV